MHDAPAPDIAIIGAGPNGLTAATRLALQGRRVTVFDRRADVGGIAAGDRLAEHPRTPGLFHDASSLLPAAVHGLALAEHGLAFDDEPAPTLVPRRGGRGIMLHHRIADTTDELHDLAPRDAERYRDFHAFIERLAPLLDRYRRSPAPIAETGLLDLAGHGLALRGLGERDLAELLRVVPMPLQDWLSEWFESDLLKAGLAHPALHGVFGGPRSPGTTAAFLLQTAAQGRPVRGGPLAVIDALHRAAIAAGVDIRTATDVTAIEVRDRKVTGVELADGTVIRVSTVIATCDPKHTFLELLSPRVCPPRLRERIGHVRMRGATAKVDLVLDQRLRFTGYDDDDVRRARIGERLDDLEQAFDAIKYRRCSEVPLLDIWIPPANDTSTTDTIIASIIVHFAPHDLDGGWTDDARAALGDRVVARLAEYAPTVTDSIVERRVLTPVDLHARYGLTGGHLHHGEHTIDQLLVRPTPETASGRTPIRGLYLGGSGSHPGGGLTLAPGWIAGGLVG